MMTANAYRRAPIPVPSSYTVPNPAAVKVTYSTEDYGSELLQPRVILSQYLQLSL